MVPIGHQYGFLCVCVIVAGGSVYSHGPKETVCILQRIVAMVPGRPILCDIEFIRKFLARGNRALG